MTHDCRLIGTSSGAVSGLHQPIDTRFKSRPPLECLTLCVSPARREFGLLGGDCRTTKMRKRDARAAIAQMPHEFVSALKLPLLDWRKVPEVAEEFAKQKSQKHETRQTLDSWRRERDSNHESGRPYLFETASKFSDLGSRDQFGCAIDELRTRLPGLGGRGQR